MADVLPPTVETLPPRGAHGTICDAVSKAPVADVLVTATSPALQGEQVVVTDGAGPYRILQLPPGDSALRVEACISHRVIAAPESIVAREWIARLH